MKSRNGGMGWPSLDAGTCWSRTSRIEQTGGDGIYLGSAPKQIPNRQVTIRRVDCNANHRQGISVISAEDLLIEDCQLRHTDGTAPMAGIDFEPNHPADFLVNCVVRGAPPNSTREPATRSVRNT